MERELQGYHKYAHTIFVDPSQTNLTISENIDALTSENVITSEWISIFATHRFTFDRIFDTNSSQDDVYNGCMKDSILSVLEGYNATIIAYGQTGTGKTYTMEGTTYSNEVI